MSNDKQKIKELITRRRQQILIHSCIYYQMNNNLISDFTFDMWAKELYKLQNDYPDISKECIYYNEFKGFDGCSGYNLPYSYPEINKNASMLLEYSKKIKTVG